MRTINSLAVPAAILVIAVLAMTGCAASESGQAATSSAGVSLSPDIGTSTAASADVTSSREAPSSPSSARSQLSTTMSPTSPAPIPSATPLLSIVDWTTETGEYAGSGSAAVKLATPQDEMSILDFSCPACSGPVKVSTDSYPPSIIDRIGPYAGQILLQPTASNSIVLTVTADSDWTAAIIPLVEQPTSPLVTSGQGDAVVVIVDPASSVTLAQEGEGEFSAKIYNADGQTLTVVETGPFSATYTFQTPGFISIVAENTWTVTASSGS